MSYKSVEKSVVSNLPITAPDNSAVRPFNYTISPREVSLCFTIFPTMGNETPVTNGANKKSSVEKRFTVNGLTGPYLNADSLLQQPLPKLLRGKSGKETITYAPKITLNYRGHLAKWDDFRENGMDFYKDARIRAELDRCADVPIYMDPAIEQINSEAMTRETIQCGAEITLSGRYFCNAIAPVASVVKTLVASAHGESANPKLLPRDLAFGDSWILDQHHRVSGMEPDILLKLPIEGKDQIRLVGELKFYPTVNLGTMLKDYLKGDAKAFRGILGKFIQQQQSFPYRITYRR